jgi:hypothetical protein
MAFVYGMIAQLIKISFTSRLVHQTTRYHRKARRHAQS